MSAPREPGWHPDPEQPTTLLRWWDGERWTGRSRPTGYVTQPAGPEPVAASPPGGSPTPVFGAAPPETGGPEAARRRLRIGRLAVLVGAAVVVVAVLVVVAVALA